MKKIAFLLSGQGAQKKGMAFDFYEKDEVAKEKLNQIDKIRPNTLKQMFEGDAETLAQTKNTQPCLFVADYIAAFALKNRGITPDVVAGFSLGEIPALAVAGALTLEEAFDVVRNRANFMENATKNSRGKMAAIMKLDCHQVEKLCSTYDGVYPANYNTKYQTVVSGTLEELKRLIVDAKEAGGLGTLLNVSGGFHSTFMEEAAKDMSKYLEGLTFKNADCPIYANVTAEPYGDKDYKQLLAEQIKSPVYWHQTILNMIDSGVNVFIEAGVGKVLSNMVKKIIKEEKLEARNIYVDNVENMEDLERVIKNVKG